MQKETKIEYISHKKSELNVLKIEDIKLSVPDLKNITESKSVTIAKWLISWIKSGLKDGSVKINDIIPTKAEFAYKLGVSIGTMQNAYRYVEDCGYTQSKQCIGTIICDKKNSNTSMRKLTSKREGAVEEIKRYIAKGGYKIGAQLPSSRAIAAIIEYSQNTTRLALEYLSTQGIIEHRYKNSNEYGWFVNDSNFEISTKNSTKQTKTLVDMIKIDLEKYITKNLKVGDKMPAHNQLAKELKTSIKTVHDALKMLISEDILLARRGKYGTTVIKMPHSSSTNLRPEMSIFAPAKDTAFYHYEKTQNHIKRMIAQKYEVGDKLPSILELSKELDLSPNTIRKAFHNLAKEGYLVFSRGRYGGTFVIDIPEVETQAFKWLAVNPQFAKTYTN